MHMTENLIGTQILQAAFQALESIVTKHRKIIGFFTQIRRQDWPSLEKSTAGAWSSFWCTSSGSTGQSHLLVETQNNIRTLIRVLVNGEKKIKRSWLMY